MNKVYAIVGPPASGKTLIVKQLFKKYGIPALISHTTRPPKKGEQHGVDYYFVEKQAFASQPFAERATYSEHYYGLSKEEVLKKVNLYPVSVVDIDMNGFEQLKKLLGDRLESIYLLVDKDTVLSRCLVLGDSQDEIRQRIEYAEKNGEFNNWQSADHVVKNSGAIETTLRQILAVMDLVTPQTAPVEG
ncbi:MAG TPA: guanylate kinase [Selenomonadales bacterium]|nr:guanylate kinase [Selenomonadales bacterium]